MGRHAAPGPPDTGPAAEPARSAGQWSWATSLVVGAVVGLVAGGVLGWAGQPWAVAVAAGCGVLAVVVGAAWVARSVGGRQPLQ